MKELRSSKTSLETIFSKIALVVSLNSRLEKPPFRDLQNIFAKLLKLV